MKLARLAMPFIFALSIIIHSSAIAEPVYFSRANCGNNESISFEPKFEPKRWWEVRSEQFVVHAYAGYIAGNIPSVVLESGLVHGIRAAAVNWVGGFHGLGGFNPVYWIVQGSHYERGGENFPRIKVADSYAEHCNLEFRQFFQ